VTLLPCKRCGKQPEWNAHSIRYVCPDLDEHELEDTLAEEKAKKARAAVQWNNDNRQQEAK
jgi:hypothetical protein